MRIIEIEKELGKDFVEKFKKGGWTFLRHVSRTDPLRLMRFRKAIYDYGKANKKVWLVRWLELKFSDLKPKPLGFEL
jgi:hypothetical protein